MIAGIRSDPPWQDFIHRLRLQFAGSHANLIFRRSDLAENLVTLSSSEAVERFGNLVDLHEPGTDPIPYYRMRPFRAYLVEEFLDGLNPADHPFTGKFLMPLGMDRLMICRVTTPCGMQGWLSVTRGGADGFSRAELEHLQAIARTFAEALAVFGAFKGIEGQRDAYARAARARATGLVRLDRFGQVVHMDAAAQHWISGGCFLKLVGQHLHMIGRENGDRLGQAIESVLGGARDEEFLIIDGGDAGALELLIYPAGEAFESAWTNGARVLIYMGMVGQEIAPSPQRLTQLFNLTRREAALALLLTRGHSLTEAASELGISDQTARAYLKQVFQKSGATRQAELVRRIQGSIAAIQ
jgi:DNA-binding CsgD family transcriptional regulator